MKALKYGFGLALIAGFTLAACGGSSSDSDDSSAAGSSSAGESSTAGAGTTTAGTGSTVAGGSSVGGETTGTGGVTGVAGNGTTTAGAGGKAAGMGGTTASGGAAATNPMDCPAALPTGKCTELANNMERCSYGDESCRCRVTGGGMMNQGDAGATAAADGVWQCTAVCPTAKPTVGDACAEGGEVCPYMGDGICTCSNNTKKWQCFGGTTGNGGASGTAGAGGGTANTPCPKAKPADASACTGDNICQYGAKNGCICDGTKWVCTG